MINIGNTGNSGNINNAAKTVGIYVRRSVFDKDNNSLSVESQEADCIKFLNEGERYQVYCDNGKSGKDIEHRPAFKQMMEEGDVSYGQ